MHWERPPADTTVAALVERWLPDAYAASGCRAPADAPRLRASISGTDGGAWDVQPGRRGLVVTAPKTALPDLWIRQSAPDFLAAFVGDPDLPELLPPGWSPLDLLFLDPRDVEMLRQVSGRVLVEIEGRRRRRWAFDVAFGKAGMAAGRPRSTIRLDGATFDGLRSGRIPPMKPLVDGSLKLVGDRNLAVQLLLLIGKRLNRR